MRLKFRVWDKENKEFFEPTYDAINGNLSEITMNQKGDLMLRDAHGISHESTFNDRFEVTYCSGLEDKNGNKIWEGDICKFIFQTPFGLLSKNGVMEFIDGTFKIKFHIDESINIDMTPTEEEPEIVGNIFKNKELL